MKKTKLLIPIISTTTLACAAGPIFASCSCQNKGQVTVSAITDATYIIGNDTSELCYFTVDKDIEKNQTVSVVASLESAFEYKVEQIYNKKVIAVRITKRNLALQETIHNTVNLTFTCANSDGSIAWTSILKNYDVWYSTIASIPLEQRAAFIDRWVEGTPSYTYELDLVVKDIEINRVKVAITNVNNTEPAVVAELAGNPELTEEGKLLVPIKMVASSGSLTPGYSKVNFSMTISYLDDYGSPIVTPVTLTGFQLTYLDEEKVIDWKNDLDWDTTNHILKGIKGGATINDKNTLVIPSAVETGWTFKIANNAFKGSSNLPDNITKLKFNGIGCVGIGASAFEDTKIRVLDISAYPASIEGIEDMKLGTNSFAFATARLQGSDGTGAIIWNKNLSFYQKHTIKHQLFVAGLQGLDWYEFTHVSTEAQLRQAAWTGGNILIENDIELTDQIEFNNTSAVLDLNGYQLYQTKSWHNHDKKKYAMISIWDAQVIVCDSDYSGNGNGGIRCCTTPAQPGTKKYDWCFMVRSDTPEKERGSLDILGGTYISNDYCVYNSNGDVYIEDWNTKFYKDSTLVEKHQIPKFYLNKETINDENGAKNMLNCNDETYLAGTTHFYVYGGEFYTPAYDDETKIAEKYRNFNPAASLSEGETPVSFLPPQSEGNYVSTWIAEGKYYSVTKG